MTQNEPNQAKRASRRPSGPAYWLIAKNESGRIEVLTLERDAEEMLPVFSFEEEAEIFLGLGGLGCSWRVSEIGAGELVSVLYGPCASVKEVALDPLPEMVAERTIGLVSLDRERFIECITARSRFFRLCEPTRGSSPREGERSRRSEADRILTHILQGASHSLGTGYGIGFPRRNYCC